MSTTVHQDVFGKEADGTTVHSFLLQNSKGLRVTLLSWGAMITHVQAPGKDGKLVELTLTLPTFEDYLAMKPGATYLGSLVGRFANRIKEGKFTLEGKSYQLAINNGPNHLHGGKVGYAHKVWNAEVVDHPTGKAVQFTIVSPDGDENYPGTLKAKVIYSLNDDNELRFDEHATTDQTTICSLTNHAFWNLAGKGSVLDQVVQLNSKQYVPVDSTLIPFGRLDDVAGTPFDFSKPKKISTDFAQVEGGYDHCWVINRNNADHSTLVLAADVTDPASGRRMTVSTTKVSVQFYTGNFLPPTHSNANEFLFDKNWGLCLETQHLPDAPNQPSFPSCVLKPGQEYCHATVHKFFL